jgi:hypothetical protein
VLAGRVEVGVVADVGRQEELYLALRHQGVFAQGGVVAQGGLVGTQQLTDAGAGLVPGGAAQRHEGVQRRRGEDAPAAQRRDVEETLLFQEGEVEDQVADGNADARLAAGAAEDAVGEVLDGEVRLRRDWDEGAQGGVVGRVHGGLPVERHPACRFAPASRHAGAKRQAALQPSQRPQVVAGLVEAAAAEGDDPPPGRDDLLRTRTLVLPAEARLVEYEVAGVFVLEDRPKLLLSQSPCVGQDGGAEDVDEAVHPDLQARVETADGVVQAGRELQRPPGVAAGRDDGGDIPRRGKGRRLSPAAPELEAGT